MDMQIEGVLVLVSLIGHSDHQSVFWQSLFNSEIARSKVNDMSQRAITGYNIKLLSCKRWVFNQEIPQSLL